LTISFTDTCYLVGHKIFSPLPLPHTHTFLQSRSHRSFLLPFSFGHTWFTPGLGSGHTHTFYFFFHTRILALWDTFALPLGQFLVDLGPHWTYWTHRLNAWLNLCIRLFSLHSPHAHATYTRTHGTHGRVYCWTAFPTTVHCTSFHHLPGSTAGHIVHLSLLHLVTTYALNCLAFVAYPSSLFTSWTHFLHCTGTCLLRLNSWTPHHIFMDYWAPCVFGHTGAILDTCIFWLPASHLCRSLGPGHFLDTASLRPFCCHTFCYHLTDWTTGCSRFFSACSFATGRIG